MAPKRPRVLSPSGFQAIRLFAPLVILGAIIAAAALAPWIAPDSPTTLDFAKRFASPSADHLLGADNFGRDVLSRLIYGARVTMQVALLGTGGAMLLGVALGLIGGYFAGFAEVLTMRLTDVILSIPSIVLALVVITVFGSGLRTLTLVIVFLFIPAFARITYSQVLSVKRMEFVEAARALGAGHLRIMLDAILRNVLAPVIVQFSLSAAAAVLLESGLSFLGLGITAPTPSWGVMVQEARPYMEEEPANLLWPCLALTITILALNTLGDALRDRLDPRIRGSALEPGVIEGEISPDLAREPLVRTDPIVPREGGRQ